MELSPDPNWPNEICGACGYHCIGHSKSGHVTRKGCRLSDFDVAKDDPACPSFIMRPAKGIEVKNKSVYAGIRGLPWESEITDEPRMLVSITDSDKRVLATDIDVRIACIILACVNAQGEE